MQPDFRCFVNLRITCGPKNDRANCTIAGRDAPSVSGDETQTGEESQGVDESESGALFSHLDRFACEWSWLENTGPLILQLYSLDHLKALLEDDKTPVREFGFIMLRLALTDSVPWDAVPLLCELFTDYFDRAPFLSRLYIAKVFLAIFPDMGHDMCQAILPTGIAHRIRSCTDGHLTQRELVHYQEAIALLVEDFEQEDEEEREDGRD
jgi:hypothetical protein